MQEVQPTNQPVTEQPTATEYFCPTCHNRDGSKTVLSTPFDDNDHPITSLLFCYYCTFGLGLLKQKFKPADLVGYEVGGVLGDAENELA